MNMQLDQLLACYCGAVLMGKKPAALISQPPDMRAALRSVPVRSGNRLNLLILRRPGRDDLVFLYNAGLLERTLQHAQAQSILAEFGYPRAAPLEDLLRHLRRRLQAEDFPHEVGLFLGYPPDDVEGFILNRGRNYKECCGWKVYGDASRARRLSAEHRSCRDYLMAQVEQGRSVFDLCM